MTRRSSDLDPAFDPAAERLLDIGRQLRETRQQRGEDLYDVADYLRIKPSYLFALEEGDLKAMPGRTYAMGFLRTYADHLGYDGVEVVRGLNVTPSEKSDAALKVREPVPENRLPSLAMVVGAMVLAGVAYGGWFAAQSGEQVFTRIKAVPGEIGQYAASLFEEDRAPSGDSSEERPLEMLVAGNAASSTSPATTPSLSGTPTRSLPTSSLVAGSTATPTGSGDQNAAEGPLAGLQAREVPVDSTPGTGAAASGATTDLTAAVATANRPSPAGGAASSGEDTLAGLVLDAEAERSEALRRLDEERPDGGTVGELMAALQSDAATAGEDAATAPVTSTTGRVVLLAREASWIQVQSPSRDFLRSTTLEPGERFEIPDRTDLALWTGNAGGIEIWVDGQTVGVLGRSGAVVRNISLAPESLIERR